jgi:Leucine-rich repeat (LRR) protein
LYVFDNHLTDLTLSNLAQLQTFKANNNNIEYFAYSNIPKLQKIYIFNNELETIDIYNLPSLQYMDCRQNPMPDSLYDSMDKIDDVTFLHDGNAEDW